MTVSPATRLALLAAALLGACSGTATPAGGAANAIAIQLEPPSAQVAAGGSVSFAAVVTGTANTSVTWAVQEGAPGGSVTAAGAYTAPATAGNYHVVATSQADAAKRAIAPVTVTAPPTAVTVAISPSTASINSCQSFTFGATVGGTTNTAVTWSVQEGAAGGTITAAGAYTAPSTAGTYHVVATSQADATKSAVATVVVSDQILGVAVSPAQATVPAGGSQAFTATVTTTCGSFTSTQVVTAPN